MHKELLKIYFLSLFLVLVLSACSSAPGPTVSPVKTNAVAVKPSEPAPASPTATAKPPRLLTICMGSEPKSLFLYGDNSAAARSIREAIYDGPFDSLGFDVVPVILTEKPSLANGAAVLEAVKVQPGSLIQDATGKLTTLDQGVAYLPSGCKDAACAQKYSGQDPASMDELAVRFKLRPGLLWSDGTPLTADDSVYSFELAKSMYPRARADLIARTQSYQALDPSTLEWRAIPGFLDGQYPSNFFTPLPRHAWGSLAPAELLTAEAAVRLPLGWGPYKIDEWTPGDHISLSKNPTYFRAGEGLPHFDKLVFRFVASRDEALNALLAGECDYVDETAGLEAKSDQMLQLQSGGRIQVAFTTGTAWEHADFGIAPYNSKPAASAGSIGQASRPALFQQKETRQAVAQCIDRPRMAKELFFGQSLVPDTYVLPADPLYNKDARRYDFDPQKASARLESLGWTDPDNNPATPRLAHGVAGVPDGTPFQFTYLTAADDENQRAAQIVKDSLAQCGIQVDLKTGPGSEIFASGPDGPIFGRNFDMAQFAWTAASEPPCYLYTTGEIPGPYPDFPKGWGGANNTGYSSPEFDQACQQALFSLPDWTERQEAHRKAQAIFAEDLPVIPLYLRLKLVAMRPDLCNVVVDPSADSALWNLEKFDYGTGCGK